MYPISKKQSMVANHLWMFLVCPQQANFLMTPPPTCITYKCLLWLVTHFCHIHRSSPFVTLGDFSSFLCTSLKTISHNPILTWLYPGHLSIYYHIFIWSVKRKEKEGLKKVWVHSLSLLLKCVVFPASFPCSHLRLLALLPIGITSLDLEGFHCLGWTRKCFCSCPLRTQKAFPKSSITINSNQNLENDNSLATC